ncbi:TIGR03617 family F420-dependent LLM class oxidoreductase [Patulibacter sp. NPDC049589]|uniref:TIGR03617 family F420-dependent LLM class oxidoreductase n=1 Tax=Patulibacter sp. NPDC049589 TaxID=3154731 RepID=UPI003442C6C8
MLVESSAYAPTVDAAAAGAVAAEAGGYDGWHALEMKTDPFLACAVAAERTERVELATGIAVAFARNPMTVAIQANDLQALSGGRFVLGLGSQIRPHITKRYSMPWGRPAARMREFVLAVRAIWHSWETGEDLRFRGEFYKHTLMTPFFDPGPNPHGNPKVLLAGVGPLMTGVAGEVGDGMICHHFSTERFVREATIPALLKGRERAGHAGLDGFELTAPGLLAIGDTEEELTASVAWAKERIAFYGSTPAYRPVLELHGWGDLQTDLNELSKRGEWAAMNDLIPDEVLHEIAVVGSPEEVVDELLHRYGDVAARVPVPLPESADPDRWRALFDRLRAG